MDAVVGIIAEYNPFHNGHRYQIAHAREKSGASCVVAVMNGNFSQRGMPMIADKWSRGAAAVRGGVNLVLELPFAYGCSSAECFAEGGVAVLQGLGCVTHLSFGCETEKPELLSQTASVLAEESGEFRGLLREDLDRGLSFPAARCAAVRKLCGEETGEVLCSPNNILAVEYLKQCLLRNWCPTPVPILRKGGGYGEDKMREDFSGASAIRKAYDAWLSQGKEGGRATAVQDEKRPSDLEALRRNLPESSMDMLLRKGMSETRMEKVLLSLIKVRLLTAGKGELAELASAGEGLENRLRKGALQAASMEELIRFVKSKRYTETRVRRLLIHALFGYTKQMKENRKVYARVLAFDQKGAELLRTIRKRGCASIPIFTNATKECEPEHDAFDTLRLDYLSSELYALLRGEVIFPESDYVKCPTYVETK